ncbi:MAG: ATP-binding protein [Bacteroidia bacterium]
MKPRSNHTFRNILISVFAFFSLFGCIKAQNIILNDQLVDFRDSLSIHPFAQILTVSEGKLSFDEVAKMNVGDDFEPFDNIPAPIQNKGTYWLHVEMTNPDSIEKQWVLFLGYEQEVEVFGAGQEVLLGTMIPQSEKKGNLEPGLFLRDEGFSGQILLKLKAKETRTIYLRIKRTRNQPRFLHVILFTTDFWEKITQPEFRHFNQGVYQGMIWALILYHLLFFFTTRDPAYLLYCIYMASISMLTLGDFGYWYSLLENYPFAAWITLLFLQYFVGIMTFVFMQSFVQLKRLMPKWNQRVTWFIRANMILLLTQAVIYLITQDYAVVQFGKWLIVPFAVVGIFFCYLLIRSRDTVALYFAVAGVVLSVVIMVNGIFQLLEGKQILLETPYHHYYMTQIAAIVHLMTFAIGMGFRRRQIDMEKQRVVELDTLKTRLYTNITHEFRTPLTVIMGMNEQIQGHEQEKKLIRRNSQNLLRLINQLLDLSRLDSGKLELHKINGDIVSYLQYLTESFHSMAAEKNIRLTFYSEIPSLTMDYDEVKLQHIVYNLLSNAIKFTPEKGKIVFHIRAIQKKEMSFLQMIVQDNGIGISPQHLPHIFDRFYQADDSSTRKGEGTGIGLALTRELIDLMGGKITVTSDPEKGGSEFKIWLPVENKSEKQAEQPSLPDLETLPLPGRVEPGLEKEDFDNIYRPILLLIEDNPDVIVYIRTLLQADYQIYFEENGQKGIDKALEIVPDIIISDVMMPEKDGYEVCQILKEDPRTSHIPIILLTAKASPEDRIEGLKYGADAYLTKPFNKEELHVRLQKLVELRRRLQIRYTEDIQETTSLKKSAQHPIEDAFIKKLREQVEAHIDDTEFGVSQLTESAEMSPIQLYRKLKALTDSSPSQFIRTIRLQKAKNMLINTNLTISEIAYDVGFSDPNYFSRMFLQMYRTSPGDFRKKNK